MKVTLFFGSLIANHVLAIVTVRYRADFDHAHAYSLTRSSREQT